MRYLTKVNMTKNINATCANKGAIKLIAVRRKLILEIAGTDQGKGIHLAQKHPGRH